MTNPVEDLEGESYPVDADTPPPLLEPNPDDPNDMGPGSGDPQLAAHVYQYLGFDVPGVTSDPYRSPMAGIQPGDLVGWYGSQDSYGGYTGNMAVYAGDGQIIESIGTTKRRRKLHPTENTFSIRVNVPRQM